MPLTRPKQVLGAPKSHDLGSAGADQVQLQSDGLKLCVNATQLDMISCCHEPSAVIIQLLP